MPIDFSGGSPGTGSGWSLILARPHLDSLPWITRLTGEFRLARCL